MWTTHGLWSVFRIFLKYHRDEDYGIFDKILFLCGCVVEFYYMCIFNSINWTIYMCMCIICIYRKNGEKEYIYVRVVKSR